MIYLKEDRSVRSPLCWYGGKSLLQNWVRQYLPPCEKYVEVFGGSGAVLFARQPAREEVYNDIMPELANFFRVVKDPVLSSRLVEQLALTPYARLEHRLCSESGRSADPVEWARRTFVLTRQSYSAIYDHTWGYQVSSSSNPFAAAIKLIPAASRRLAGVRIENQSAPLLIATEDGPETLFYLDPPYLGDTRVSPKVYKHEMDYTDHERLLDQLCSLQGMAVLSGYPNSGLYDTKLSHWVRVSKSVHCFAAPNSQGGLKPKRTECLWLNPAAVERLRQRSQTFCQNGHELTMAA